MDFLGSPKSLFPRAEAAGAASSAAAAAVPGSGVQTPGAEPVLTDTLPLPPGWKQAKGPDGRLYYIKGNPRVDGTTRSTRPTEPAPRVKSLGWRAVSLGWLHQRVSQISLSSSPSASGTMTPISGVASAVAQSIVALAVAASSVASVLAASSSALAVAA